MADSKITNERLLEISRRNFTRADIIFGKRRKLNEENWRAYLGLQDFTYKTEFQSQERTPSFPIAVEHIVGTFERALTDTDDWLHARPAGLGAPLLEPEIIAHLLMFYLERLHMPGNKADTAFSIQQFVGDATKRGLMEPIVVAKVWPVLKNKRMWRYRGSKPKNDQQGSFNKAEFLGGKLQAVDVETMRLALELVPYEDYFPDPTPHKRWEIHRTRRQVHELLANPDYDPDAVRRLMGAQSTTGVTDRRKATRSGETNIETDPNEVEVFEGWGDLIDFESGELLAENVFWAWSGNEVLRPPTPNPYWDGTSPFVVAPMLRVPNGTEGKALADHAVPMWRALNEVMNLIIDQGIRGTWGVGQIHQDMMESPEDVADGIPTGYTAILKPNSPAGKKFYERVDNGDASPVSLEVVRQLEGYLQESLATPDTRLGTTPERATKATDTVAALQASGSLYESFAARYEDSFLEPIFEKCWKLILQYVPDFLEQELVQILGPTNVLRLEEMSSGERFKLLSSTVFKVRGLRGVASKERRFQKMMTVLNLLSSNEQFADWFGRHHDIDKFMSQLFVTTGIDPATTRLVEPPPGVAQEAPPEGTIAGGQLDASLSPSSGASQPNVGSPQGEIGAQTQFAPNNPAANAAI